MRRILIKRGTLVLVDKGVLVDRDLLIKGNRVLRIDRGIQDPQAYVIDASGFLVGPGLVNMHVHFRELESASEGDSLLAEIRAALKGGFTSIVVMPNTTPPLDEPLVVDSLRYRCQE
ncbi:MAG: amidohydrolase family protein, partial [Candidatus Atribacteria bacterium]|nr:amidohydrolase family protein [Candidatus Atribacteria bacterium]MCD6349388.1 amidohydrolase family protein [Candidatus Atribacteria bacterium]